VQQPACAIGLLTEGPALDSPFHRWRPSGLPWELEGSSTVWWAKEDGRQGWTEVT